MVLNSVCITGGNRGIGLELVRQFLNLPQGPNHVFATCRNPESASDLIALKSAHPGKLHILQLEITNYESFPKIASDIQEIVGEDGLNLLINNAGILPMQRYLEDAQIETMMEAFQVNCVAPMFLTRALLPLLEKSASKNKDSPMGIGRAGVVQMSSSIGSINENASGRLYAYRTSKAALNMVMKTMSLEFKSKGIITICMHPGHVQTDMGGKSATLTAQDCVSQMIDTLQKMNEKDHGCFLRYNYTSVSW